MLKLFEKEDNKKVILDTCVLIDIFDASEELSYYTKFIYENFQTLISNEKIFISTTTQQELSKAMDKQNIISSLLKNKYFIIKDHKLIQSETLKFWNKITNKPTGANKDMKEENIKNDITNCFTAKHHNAFLVSSEKMQTVRSGDQKLKIPNICKAEDIKFMKTIEFLYILGVNTPKLQIQQKP